MDEVTRALLDEAWAALTAGVPDPPVRPSVVLTGDADGALPSRLPVLPAMVAAVAASTAAAAVLDAARRGRDPEPVTVDVAQVAVAARSERFARQAGARPASSFAPLSRFWRSADGWVRLHANYPWHRDRALATLGCGSAPDEVAAAIGSWRGADLEDAFAAAGALVFAVRTPAEWAAHPQGRAVAGLPLVRAAGGRDRPASAGRRPWALPERSGVDGAVTGRARRARPAPGRSADRPGGGPSASSASTTGVPPGRAAAGVRVLDLTRVIAGPVATRTLAAWGSDVLRIDAPHLPESVATARDTLPGKRSTELDLGTPAGRATLERLLADADVVVHGYRPGALSRFGLGAAELADRHPHLVVATLSAWGGVGPWGARRGFDSLVQCPTGIASVEGDDDAPGAMPAQALDHATGYLAAAAALLGLAEVAAGRPATASELSLAATARWLSRPGAPAAEVHDPDPAPFLVALSGAGPTTHVVGPPGRVGDLLPAWSGTTTLGADRPEFAPIGENRPR